MRVSPFRYPRIIRYLLLPVAFRSLSRLSSALSAKASTLRSFQLNQLKTFVFRVTSVLHAGILSAYNHDLSSLLFFPVS